MEPVSVLTTCLTVAKGAYEIVNQVKNKYEHWSDSSFNIVCLQTDLLTAKTFLSAIIPDVGPRLPFFSPEIYNAVTTSFETCLRALDRIGSTAKTLNAESRRDRLKLLWNEEGLERQRLQLNSQLDGLRRLIDVIQEPHPQQQQWASVGNSQWINAKSEDDSDDDVTINPLLSIPPSCKPTNQTLRRKRSLHFSTSKKASRALIQAALVGDVMEMEKQYKQGADVKYQSRKQPPDNDGMTALHAAAQGGHYRAVEFLVQRKINVNALMINCFTPLHLAASAQHTEVVRYLIQSGADVNAQNAQGQTPLFKSDGQTTKMLLDARADPNVRDNDVNTSLHCAAYDNHLEAIKLLKAANVDVNIRNREGKTALWLACDRTDDFNVDKSLEVVDTLLRRKANPNIACQQGMPPLELCIQENRPRLVDRLIKFKADATFRTKSGMTLLHIAATLQSEEIFGM